MHTCSKATADGTVMKLSMDVFIFLDNENIGRKMTVVTMRPAININITTEFSPGEDRDPFLNEPLFGPSLRKLLPLDPIHTEGCQTTLS